MGSSYAWSSFYSLTVVWWDDALTSLVFYDCHNHFFVCNTLLKCVGLLQCSISGSNYGIDMIFYSIFCWFFMDIGYSDKALILILILKALRLVVRYINFDFNNRFNQKGVWLLIIFHIWIFCSSVVVNILKGLLVLEQFEFTNDKSDWADLSNWAQRSRTVIWIGRTK